MSVHPEITPPSNFHHFRDTTAFGNYLLVVVNRTTPATVSAPLIYFQLIAATVIGFFVFGDWPEPLTLLGLAVIFASGVGGLALVPKR
ncbi:hypothetical protein ACEPPZ_20830 [Paracoccus yeei]|uniref:hypothetical protein n=1 Tax=Paracoccus yeei TaxID=147645 RepID=UPI0037D2C68B